jgi:hypothetical protein
MSNERDEFLAGLQALTERTGMAIQCEFDVLGTFRRVIVAHAEQPGRYYYESEDGLVWMPDEEAARIERENDARAHEPPHGFSVTSIDGVDPMPGHHVT